LALCREADRQDNAIRAEHREILLIKKIGWACFLVFPIIKQDAIL